MSRFSDRFARDVKRADDWTKAARVTAEVAATALNPLAGPVMQQADLVSPKPLTEISQDVAREQEKDWAHHELLRREQASGHVADRPGSPTAARQESRTTEKREAKRNRER
jgi:hypothetical protein